MRTLRAGQPAALQVDGEVVELSPEEIIVDTQSPEGLAVASDRGITVAVDAVITPELRDEGLVRDLVRHVQTLRRDVDYALGRRIVVGLLGLGEGARAAVERFREYLMGETLAEEVVLEDDGGVWDGRSVVRLGGEDVVVAVRRG